MARTRARRARSSSDSPFNRLTGWLAERSTALFNELRPEGPAFRRAAGGLLWAGGIAGIAVALGTGVPRLQSAVARSAFNAHPDFVFLNVPEWMDHDLLEQLATRAVSDTTGSPLRQADLVTMRSELLATGWFDEIRQVRRLDEDRVLIDARFATRFAVIRDRDGDHLVDPTGRLLPESRPHGSFPEMTAVTGIDRSRPALPGRTWPGTDIIAALSLVRSLQQRPWRDQIASIDTSSYLTDGTIHLRTDLGATILWGSPPGEETVLELHAEDKLRILDHAFRDCGRIDCGFSGTWYFLHEGYMNR